MQVVFGARNCGTFKIPLRGLQTAASEVCVAWSFVIPTATSTGEFWRNFEGSGTVRLPERVSHVCPSCSPPQSPPCTYNPVAKRPQNGPKRATNTPKRPKYRPRTRTIHQNGLKLVQLPKELVPLLGSSSIASSTQSCACVRLRHVFRRMSASDRPSYAGSGSFEPTSIHAST